MHPIALHRLILALSLVLVASTTATARAAGEDIPELFESSFANEATGNTDKALNDVLKILRLDDRSYVANLRAGWLYYFKGRYLDSVTFYERAEELAPGALEPRLGLMLPLMAAARWKKAETLARAILKKAPHDYLATSRLAFVLYSQGRYKEAETQYRKVLANYPSDVDMMLGLGWTYVKQGRTADARGVFEKVLTIKRENVNARAGLQAL